MLTINLTKFGLENFEKVASATYEYLKFSHQEWKNLSSQRTQFINDKNELMADNWQYVYHIAAQFDDTRLEAVEYAEVLCA